MDGFDFSPLFRSTIGFDRLTRLLDAATRVDSASLGYPPYNIEKTGDDAYRLTMAVAGFSPSELDITVQENTLLVTGKTPWHSPATPKSDSVRITTIPLRIACRCIVPRMVKGSMPLAACKRS